MGHGRGKLAYFRRGKLAHLFSMNKIFQKSVQYFIAFSDYISHILSPEQTILLQKRIHGHRNVVQVLLYKPLCGILHVGQLTPSCGPTYPDAGKVGPCLPPLQKSQCCEKYGSLRKRLRIRSVISVNYHYIIVLCPFN